MAKTAKKPSFPGDEHLPEATPFRKATPNRTPLRVELLTFFTNSAIKLYGKQITTSCRTTHNRGVHKGYEIDYYPWFQAFRVTFHPGQGEPPKYQYVPAVHVMHWEFPDGAQG